MTDAGVESIVDDITTMDLEGLRKLWGKRYGAPPTLRSVPIMRMLLAFRVQAEAYGGLDTETRRMIARTGTPRAEGRHLGVGARLTRNWKGCKVEVIVEEDGFRWNGQVFRSLTAAATAIAGCRFNGPRFFGLRDQP